MENNLMMAQFLQSGNLYTYFGALIPSYPLFVATMGSTQSQISKIRSHTLSGSLQSEKS